jgi:mannosylglucosylglycerate synthase
LLRGLGHEVRLIVGSGTSGSTSDVVVEPLLDPTHPAMRGVPAHGRGNVRLAEHPLVGVLQRRLSAALQGCCQCWVHNVFTLDLHPVLRLALLRLVEARKDVGWAAWCHDLSATSAYRADQPAPGLEEWTALGLSCATISSTRKHELSVVLGLEPDEIAVIPPPIDALGWLDIGAEARAVAEAEGLVDAEPIALVPSKVLPHKNLEMAIQVAVQLRGIAPSPRLVITAAESPHEPDASSTLGVRLRKCAAEADVAGVVVFAPDVLGGTLTSRGVRDLMCLADVVWIPSTEEGYGLPVREASLLRVPVLCSDIPAFRELQTEGVHLVPIGDSPESIASRLQSFARRPESRGRRNAMRSTQTASRALERFVESIRVRRHDVRL